MTTVPALDRRDVPRGECTVPEAVARRAYEVYGVTQSQSFDRVHERGGFSAGELIAMLYARSFPREEWKRREHEAYKGMRV